MGRTAEDLAGATVSAIETRGDDETISTVVVVDDGQPELLVMALKGGAAPPADVFVRQAGGAMAVRVNWAPDQILPTRPCWSIVAVTPDEPAFVVVGPYGRQWHLLDPLDLPWFLASTAGGIRASLKTGKLLNSKSMTRDSDPRLLDPVARSNPPAVDDEGLV